MDFTQRSVNHRVLDGRGDLKKENLHGFGSLEIFPQERVGAW